MDDDTYIDLNKLHKNLNNIYQLQINNDKIIIKQIGIMSNIPDIIIKKSFGKNNNLDLYNVVYTENELLDNKNFYPIIKLIENKNYYSLSIKFIDNVKCNEEITNFEIYFICFIDNKFYNKKIEKNVNQSNIIETLMELSISFIQ